MTTKRLIVGISGASGAIFGVRLLEVLKNTGIETHLIISKAAHITLKEELGLSPDDVRKHASHYHQVADIAATISSGSFKTMGMVIVPCSVRTMSEICSGVTTTLLTRAADVTLKEGRRLVLAVRETPLHAGHLRSMMELAQMGAIIAPPVPAFYNKPQSVDDLVNHFVGRVLDLFDIETDLVKRWRGV